MKIFEHDFRVRYAETDQMGVVYYANYLVWFEMGRAEYLRFHKIDYPAYEQQGFFLPVVEAHCRYMVPAAFDEHLQIAVVVSEITASSIRFEYEIRNKATGQKGAEGYTRHVFINRERKPVRIPEELKAAIPLQKLDASG